MAHNTPLANAEFRLQFSTTNLRYLLGNNPRNEPLIAKTRAWIADAEKEIETLRKAELIKA